jgi:Ca2+-binding EF-hand superfamily protein
VLDEGKLADAQNILHAMFHSLERSHAITPEEAFGIYDISEYGLCTQEEFKRIVSIFFDGAAPEGEKLDFVMRLALQEGETKIRYREFCKLL